MWIKDPKDKQESVTLTLLIIGFAISCVKLLISGISVGKFVFTQFSGMDFAGVVGALGSIYAARRSSFAKDSGNGGD